MKDYPTFVVAQIMHGEIMMSPAQKKIIQSYIHKHEGDFVRFALSQPTKPRSNNQNAYYWSVVMIMLAAETGHTTEEIHEFMKSMFLPRAFLKVGNTEQQLVKSTTTLSTIDFENYLERIRVFAATELQMTIPLPHEYDS